MRGRLLERRRLERARLDAPRPLDHDVHLDRRHHDDDRAPTDLAAVNIKLTKVAELERPTAMAIRAGRHDAVRRPRRPGGSARSATASSTRRPCSTSRSIGEQLGNEQGLLGLAFSPDGSKLYVDYTNRDGDTRVDEYAVDADGAVDTASRREVLAVDQPQANHNGGELAFGPDGMLYIGLGDGGDAGDQGPGHASGRQRPVARHAARQDPAHRPDAERRPRRTRSRPTTRS